MTGGDVTSSTEDQSFGQSFRMSFVWKDTLPDDNRDSETPKNVLEKWSLISKSFPTLSFVKLLKAFKKRNTTTVISNL